MTASSSTTTYRSRGFVAPMLVALAALALLLLAVPTARRPVRLAKLLSQSPPEKLPVPVAGVKASRLSNTWGAARSGGRRHEGIDIFARRSTPVRSTTEGVVVSTASNRLGGTCIVVMGPGGHRHYYAHLERHGRYGVGDWVGAGDTIGYVGNSGNARSTPPHLHYGIYTASGAINPYPLLSSERPASELKQKKLKKKKKPRVKRSAAKTDRSKKARVPSRSAGKRPASERSDRAQ